MADVDTQENDLAERIEKRIRAIPASNPSVMALYPQTLGGLLDRDLLRKIAQEAAAEASAIEATAITAQMARAIEQVAHMVECGEVPSQGRWSPWQQQEVAAVIRSFTNGKQ